MSIAEKLNQLPAAWTDTDPLWKGPSGEGMNGGVTQGMLSRFMSCRDRFRARYVLGLEPAPKWVVGIGYGNMWHACEEALAADGALGSWLDRLIDHTDDQLRAYPLQRDDIAKWCNICTVQFPEYVKYWQDHPDVADRTPLMQEQVFDVPYGLPSGRVVRLRGKFDSVDLIGGGVWLQENKTKGDVDRSRIERQMSFDLQTMTYLLALRLTSLEDVPALNHKCSAMLDYYIKGVRYNVVKRECTIKQHADRQLKSGFKKGETTEEWMERLRSDYYAAAPQDYFMRLECELRDGDLDKFREKFLDPLLENLCWWYDWVTERDMAEVIQNYGYPPPTWRKPFGTYDVLDEGGFTDYDSFLDTGSLSGLRRVDKLFEELQ